MAPETQVDRRELLARLRLVKHYDFSADHDVYGVNTRNARDRAGHRSGGGGTYAFSGSTIKVCGIAAATTALTAGREGVTGLAES